MFSTFERAIAFRYLRSSKQEGFVSVIAGFSFLGIALGVATLIIVLSVMNGFREELLGRIVGFSGHLWVHRIGQPLTDYNDLKTKVVSVPGVKSATPMIERQAIISFEGSARGIVIHAMDQTDLNKRSLVVDNIKSGKTLPNDGQYILIGKRLAEYLHATVGDKITLINPQGHRTAFGIVPRQKSFTISGLYEVGMHEYDKAVVFLPLKTAQDFFDMGSTVTNIEVFTHQIDLADRVASYVEQKVGPDFRVIHWQHSNNNYFQALQVERNVMFLILVLIVLIASFNIISSLIMLVKDKTKDIAIMRTMGASQKTILKIFFLNGASIGVFGTFFGFGLGLGFTLNIERIRQWLQSLTGTDLFKAEIYFLSKLPAKIDWTEVAVVVGTALLLSFLATLYPSWKAAKIDPVEALRL